MDSKVVTKKINSTIRPILKEKGFSINNSRTYWRQQYDRVDVLNFQSYNSYHAELMGCTTYSFSVNLATFLKYIPTGFIKVKNEMQFPAESQGHFRCRISKGIKQDNFLERDVWYIDKEGRNLPDVMTDCISQIQKKGFEWYNKFNSKENVFKILFNDHEDMNGTWGFGNFNSANRNKLIAYTAIELGKKELAIEKLKLILEFYKKQFAELKFDSYINQIEETETEIERIKTTHNIV